jgi:ATP-binding cassette, subfamily B, bacterial
MIALSTASAPSATFVALYRAMWRYAQGARLCLVVSAAMLVSSQLVKLAVPWMAAQVINTIQLAGAATPASALLWVAAILGIYLLSWALHGPGRILERSVGVRVRENLADALFGRLVAAPLVWHEQHHSGEVQHRVGQASRALYDFAQSQFVYLQNAVNIVGPVLALMWVSTLAGGVALVGFVLIAAVIVGFDLVLVRLAARENAAERRYAAGLLDFLGNISTVVSLRLQGAARRVVASRLLLVFAPLKKAIVLTEAKWCAVDLLTITLAWTLVVVYAWQTSSAGQTLLIGSLFMVYQYAQQAGSVIGSLAHHFQQFARTKADYASAEPIWSAPQTAESAMAITSGWQRIDLKAIEFSHGRSDGQPAGIFGAHLTLNRGERLALVGGSGSGKSTLLKLLAGLYETQKGHYEVDGVAQLGLQHLGSVATLIPQEADVFEASVLDNLTFGADHEAESIDEAVFVSAFDAVTDALPEGLATPISERGFNLSGGQRQRLALARGVLAARARGGSSLILLDEPTSALDPITEARVHQRLDRAFPDACIVASVHRTSLLAGFDRIALLVAGRVVDAGTFAELFERQPEFRQMVAGPRSAEIASVQATPAAA